MSHAAPRRIVIVGGGSSGWMTAAALARFLDPSWTVTLVESDAIGTIGVGEATIPMIRNFNQALGLNEAEFLRRTQGTVKLGIQFDGWGAPDQHYIHGFGLVGRGLGLIPFQHFWLRGRQLGLARPLGEYCLNVVAAEANRFAPVERGADSHLPPLPYAYHFDASLYAAQLRTLAERGGVARREGLIRSVNRDGENGDVTAVVLENGEEITGDLFIDCSGFRGLLIEETLQAGFEDWSHWLPCDRAVAAPCAGTRALLPYTRSIAKRAGWRWRIPLQHRTGNGYVFSSAHISEDEATAALVADLDGELLADPRVIRFTAGRRRKAWSHNVVSIGLASGFIEPLESTSLHLVQTAISRLLDFLPATGRIDPASRDDFNHRAAWEMERIRDFIVLHYHANGRRGQPLWDAVRNMAIPDSLVDRIAMFRATGRVLRDGDELFDVPGWVQVMIGQGIMPQAWHPLADQPDEAQLAGFLSTLHAALAQDAARLPEHGAFIAQNCAAEAAHAA